MDEYKQFDQQYRPNNDRNQNYRSNSGMSQGSESGVSSMASFNTIQRDNSMALPRNKKLFLKSKSLGRDPRMIDLQNTYSHRSNNMESEAIQSSHLASNVGYGSEVRHEDTMSRDSGNSSGGTPE